MPAQPHTIQSDPIGSYLEEWTAAFAAIAERPFRARQVFRWIHTRSVADPVHMTDLARSLRDKLAMWGIAMPATIDVVKRASDNTRKALIGFRGAGTVETVLIPPMPDDDEGTEADEADEGEVQGRGADAQWTGAVPMRRVTQCISSQIGCAMGCVFCASGVAGLKRNLTAGEIVAQVLLGRTMLDEGEAIRNVVLMGMGEPLHNYDAVARALRLLTHREGLDLSTRRVTVSTSGLVPEIERLGRDFRGEIALAVSIHAPDDETRSALMPINRRYPLAELVATLRAYPLARRRRITIEYTLIRGVNDDRGQARALVRLLKGIPVKINLIPMNPIAGSDLAAPQLSGVLGFQAVLREANLAAFVRRTRGDDIDAACGQLALKGAAPVRRSSTLPLLPPAPPTSRGGGEA